MDKKYEVLVVHWPVALKTIRYFLAHALTVMLPIADSLGEASDISTNATSLPATESRWTLIPAVDEVDVESEERCRLKL